MQEVIDLLEEKNLCLERFVNINDKQMKFIYDGNFDDLNDFYDARENILNMIQRVDEMIELASLNFKEDSNSPQIKERIRSKISKKDELVNLILEQDLEILSVIDRAKSDIIKELSAIKTGRKMIGAYKSGLTETKLDEEA